MKPPVRTRRLSPAALLLIAGCGGAECVSGPLCEEDPDPTPTVASIQLSSPIDSVMAVGRTVQIGAVARDASGSTVTGATFSWSASPASVLSVTTSGVVSGVGAGSGSVQASADGATGTLSLRAVDADLPGVTATLTDSFVAALVGGLDAATSAAVNTLLGECASNVANAYVLGLEQCLLSGRAISGTGSGNDAARLAVLDLFLLHAYQQLQLGR